MERFCTCGSVVGGWCFPKPRSLASKSLHPYDQRFSPGTLRRGAIRSIDPRGSDRNGFDDPTTQATGESAAAGGGIELSTVEFDSPPWDTWTAWKLMVQMLCLTTALSQGGVPLVAQLMGTSVDEMSGAGIAWAAVFMEVVQVFGVGVLLWVGTKEWPASLQWLKYEITPKGVAQGGCTFLAAFGGALFLAFLSDVFGGSAEKPIGQALLETDDISTTLAVLLAPILEELIYRGFLLPSLLKWFKPPAAVAITSAVFAAAHCNPKLSVGFFVAGCAYGGGYVLSGGNLAVATLGHALYNSAIVVRSIFSIAM